ncbi:class I histocompatibility antigen, F10 alpha chain-like isoform X1 [Conger conger]|uniref:class I histocompatibility antigen, F10 alpha chain-like isoform X1 n=1 Tax=Conger conger TaxID=82655 RepID=UPI002A5AA4FF|nr:class I histocompatibility antigen, F10 alpha chain-like isoform X1 [Conger conger]
MADQLIVCVSQNPVLYDKEHQQYKDNDVKDNVWSSIAEQLGCQDYEVHSILGTYTAVTRYEFTSVLWLDGEAVDSYSSDSAAIMPMRNWMREGDGHDLWNITRRLNMEQWDRGRTAILNDKGIRMAGAAVLQGRFGCEIELNPYLRITRTFAQFGWNGEDFLSFNLSRQKWEASLGSAVPIETKWNSDTGIIKNITFYLDFLCVRHVMRSSSFEEKESQETPQPTAALFAKRYRNTGKVILTCLVSGFRCINMTVGFYRDKEILAEKDGLLSTGIRPNGDGTCQLRKSLDISNTTEESYSCGVHFGNLTDKWDGKIWDLAVDHSKRHHYCHTEGIAAYMLLRRAARMVQWVAPPPHIKEVLGSTTVLPPV